jgi:hypothetical protein
MPRIVPSAAIAAIDRLLPGGVQPHTMLIGGAVAGAIDVIESIPSWAPASVREVLFSGSVSGGHHLEPDAEAQSLGSAPAHRQASRRLA